MARNSLRTSLYSWLLSPTPGSRFRRLGDDIDARCSIRASPAAGRRRGSPRKPATFTAEGLDVELIRVGGSTRMVAAMLGGSAPIIQAGAPAALTATAAGGDVVIIGATGTVSPFRLIARPEIKQPADLKGKKAGITTFGSTSDQVVRIALKHFELEPNKDVAILTFGAQPEVFAALQNGASKSPP